MHCTGSGGIYTRLSRLAGRTSHAATRQYVHPQRRRRPRVDGRNAFRDHELTGVGRGAGQRFGTVSATTSPRELPIPRRHRRAPIKAYCSHVSGGDQRVALAHYNYWPASCCARGNREVDTKFSRVAWRRVIVKALCGVLVAKCVSHFAQLLGCRPAGVARGLRDTSTDGSRRVYVSAVLLRRTTASVRMRAIAAAAAAASAAGPDAASAPTYGSARWLRAQQ